MQFGIKIKQKEGNVIKLCGSGIETEKTVCYLQLHAMKDKFVHKKVQSAYEAQV